MSMNLFSFTGIQNSISSWSINLFNIVITKGETTNVNNHLAISQEVKETPPSIDENRTRKTLLTTSELSLIEGINEDVIAYFFIMKDLESRSAWHLTIPIIKGRYSAREFQYQLGYYAFEGCGGGLSNTISVFYHLRKLEEKGYKVNYTARVVENNTIEDFEYISNINLEDLLNSSEDLIHYRTGDFGSIFNAFAKLKDSENNLSIATLLYR